MAVKQRVDRALRQIKGTGATLRKLSNDRVAGKRTGVHDGQNQIVEVAFE